MRNLAPQFAQKLRGSLNTLCRAWIFIRNDGLVLRVIEHDENLTIDGEVFTKANTVATGQIESALSLSPDSANVDGAFDEAGQNEASFELGNWNHASAKLLVVDWQMPEYSTHIWSGHVNGIKRNNLGFELDLVGTEHRLNNQIGRSFSRRCDAILGDGRCGVNLNQAGRKVSGAVSAVFGGDKIAISNFAAINDAPFIGGIIEFKSGILSGIKSAIKSINRNTQVEFELEAELPILPNIGDTIDIYVACNKNLDTCKTRFNNIQNFRGCPHMPGESIAFAGPTIANNDGGARA